MLAMNKLIVYTFRTFPEIEKLREIFGEIFIFGKLKEDLKKFTKIIEIKKPKYILGVAKGKSVSQLEKYAINKFGKIGVIDKNGVKKIKLYIPKELEKNFKISTKATSSFCNWTMYKIGNYLLKNKLKTKLMFVHKLI
jgi:pyrrolidone-carboxylate peptidase